MSIFRDFYYDVKPFLPLRLRMAVRRAIARAQLHRLRSRWPILPEAGSTPKGWAGWPNGKKFAFVLTHDVEGLVGLANCERLMRLEMELGFRSSFNFIPEGKYKVDHALIQKLKTEGFEVGVHDLHHNGKLFRNKKIFDAAAPRINKYLHKWGAVGFRSGFMHRNLDWLHALDIEYDMSTFDTDPFEPQPDGAHTIFPFLVREPESVQRTRRESGYVELPYTLPQDSTLFLLFNETDCSVWKRKLDWIVECGGLALVNVHPDYVSFEGSISASSFPSEIYRDFLIYVQETYHSEACLMLPREVSNFAKKVFLSTTGHPALVQSNTI